MTPNWTQMTWPKKYPTCGVPIDEESQIFIRFSLRPAVFEIFHILLFPIDSHVKFQSFIKFEEYKISKIWKSNFVRMLKTKIQKSLKRFGRDLRKE